MTRFPHTVKDEWLGAQSAGTLSQAKQLLLDCHAELRPEVNEAFAVADAVAGSLLEASGSGELSASFASNLAQKLADVPVSDYNVAMAPDAEGESPNWAPAALSKFMQDNKISLKWRAAGTGVERADLAAGQSDERLYLLRARAGFSVPAHGHSGEEWTLILSGGYHVGDTGYVVGDLHQEDQDCTHSLRIDDDGPCISLIMDEGPLKFSNPLLRLLQPIFGI